MNKKIEPTIIMNKSYKSKKIAKIIIKHKIEKIYRIYINIKNFNIFYIGYNKNLFIITMIVNIQLLQIYYIA